jgi:hypothetical protein
MGNNAIFHVTYDGPALVTHEMDVKDLAPALLAIGELLDEANRVINDGKAAIKVNIKATEPGSVDVVLSAVQDFFSQTTSLFNSDGVNSILNVRELLLILGIGGGGGGVVGLIKWIKNRPIKSVITLDTGDYQLELSDGEVKIAKKLEIQLFQAFKVRKSLETIIRTPLRKDGIERVSFKESNTTTQIVKDESEYFEAPDVAEELIDEQEIEQSLQIVNISFQDGGKWRFSDGNATFYADILDNDFIERVQKNQAAFAKDDVLRARLKRKQVIVTGGIRTDYTIIKILEHRSTAVTIKLPFA